MLSYKKKNSLVLLLKLGGYGFIGSYTCKLLKQQGHTIGIVDCYHQYYTFPNWEYQPILSQRKEITQTDYEYIGQIENLQFMEQTFEDFKPDRVIHVATYPNAKIQYKHFEKNNKQKSKSILSKLAN